MFAMNAALKTDEGYEEYRKKYVDSYNTIEEYLDVIGRDKVAALCNNPTTFLMDPYRKWIKTDAEIKQLMEEGR
jgi:glutaconate CoA-transferase subunit A